VKPKREFTLNASVMNPPVKRNRKKGKELLSSMPMKKDCNKT